MLLYRVHASYRYVSSGTLVISLCQTYHSVIYSSKSSGLICRWKGSKSKAEPKAKLKKQALEVPTSESSPSPKQLKKKAKKVTQASQYPETIRSAYKGVVLFKRWAIWLCKSTRILFQRHGFVHVYSLLLDHDNGHDGPINSLMTCRTASWCSAHK